MRDFGAMDLALASVMVVTAITMDHLMVRTSLAAYAVFPVPHLVLHATHHQHLHEGPGTRRRTAP
ncbi:MAG TPA: hypothetical protein VLZ05_24580 [Mycobacterium sp.]|nr:hypothetical protein [Mycobacterium sp.]HUH71776.1 hypothetical protein [Mycobacterium sp.]